MNSAEKTQKLKEIIASKGSMLVSYSGGADSALLAVIAKEILSNNTRCVLLDSPVVPRAEIAEARKIAEESGFQLEIIPVHVLGDERFSKNPPERCYWCRKTSAHVLKGKKESLHFACIADGLNVSDTSEHRPGLAASTEEGIVHPFIEAGITKEDIRKIAKGLGLKFWNKPSTACLSSRIPYGDKITTKKLAMIEEGEEFLHVSGFSQCRVRVHGNIARIEVMNPDVPKLLVMRESLVKTFKGIGFDYITLDLEGYRSGSMDEVLARG
jgi:pyridinium-3,5-biscarboxylic acid mononucleotide sulfurtransferase